jgi:molybdopterin molybdotransferase
MLDLSVDEALARILAAVHPCEPLALACAEALGCVLAEDVVAPLSIPPFANSGMDGFAVRVDDLEQASRTRPVSLRLGGEAAAGEGAPPAVRPGTAVRIMTGAPLPPGAEAVVPIEDVEVDGERIRFFAPSRAGRHLRPAGEDVRQGELAIPRGRELRAQEIGMLAALGVTQVRVVERPRIAIISTGDELLAAGEPLAPGKIRDANGPALAAFVAMQGGIALPLGIARDHAQDLRAKVEAARAARADLIVTSAGASAGDYDVVHNTLDADGALQIWRVNLKPGRPLLFGLTGGIPLLGLPGNPASALIVAELFLRPAIRRMRGCASLAPTTVRAALDMPQRGSERRHYLRAYVEPAEGGWRATTEGIGSGSGSLSTLVRSNALLVIPEGSGELPAGTLVDVIMLSGTP